jgi:hypothetical protein
MRELTNNQWFSGQFFDILILVLWTMIIINQNLFFKYLQNQLGHGYKFGLIISGLHFKSRPTLVITEMGWYIGIVFALNNM